MNIRIPIVAILVALRCSLFAQDVQNKEYPAELIRQIKTGPNPGEIAYSDSPFGIASVYPMATGEDGLIYINDWVYNYIDVFSADLSFVRRIDYTRFPMGLMKTYRINFRGEIVGLQEDQLVKVSRDGSLIYSLDRKQLSKNVLQRKEYYFYKDYVVFYDDRGMPAVVSPSGTLLSGQELERLLVEMRESGTVYRLPSIKSRLRTFLETTHLMLIGDRLLAPFDQCTQYWAIVETATEINEPGERRTFDVSGAQYVSLAGFDAHDNSYWYAIWPGRRLYAVISRTGRLLAEVTDTLRVSHVDNISPLGDIYKGDFEKEMKIYSFYRIRNTWDPVSGSTSEEKSWGTLVATISATSILTEPTDKNAYHPVKLFDGDPKTMWIENAKGPGIGESVTVGFDAPVTVDEIQFMPGAFWKEYWKQNYRVKSLEVKLDDKVFNANFKDEMTVQSLKLSTPVTFKTAVFTINGVYPTTKWEDTALSEIAFYNQGVKVDVDYSKFKEFLKKVP